MRDFKQWLNKMRPCINKYDYYVDFTKVYANVNQLRVELNIMNSLIGSHNIETELKTLFTRYPEVLNCIPILLAVREREIFVQDSDGAFKFNFNTMNYSIDQYLIFMKKTGLLELISNHIVNNLVDYALGVETGLDSNGRKNRGGHQMEELVESFIRATNVEYYSEMYISEIEKKWGTDLSAISADGTSTKRWDFVVKTSSMLYLLETNFYTGGGSKLNETARSYKMIAEETKQIPGVGFIWVTDGAGWRSAQRNLKETFDTMQHLYNISDMENGIFDTLFI